MQKELSIEIERMSPEGRGVCRVDGKVVFVAGALPGEQCRIRIKHETKRMAEAVVVEILVPSNNRIAPVCAEETCGGCAFRCFSYAAQLVAKREAVREQFERIGKMTDVTIQPTIGMEQPLGFRNRARFHLLNTGKGGWRLGFYASESHEAGGYAAGCPIIDPRIAAFAKIVEEMVAADEIAAADDLEVLIRAGENTLVAFESRHRVRIEAHGIARLTNNGAESVVLVQLSPNGREVLHTRCLAGQGELLFRVHGDVFSVPPRGFFQTNTKMAEKLFQVVLDAAGAGPEDAVIEVHGGVGVPGLLFGRRVRRLISIEIEAASVEAARRNAVRLGIGLDARCGPAGKLLPAALAEEPRAIVVLDPPRAGCEPELVATLVRARPRRIVYVSCDPATLARDAALLVAGGYKPGLMQPVDMFPWTAHVETVAVFDLARS